MATATATRKSKTSAKKGTRKVDPKRLEEQRAWSKERAAEMQASIKSKVEAMESSEEWKAYLDYMHSFHSYSFRNLILILTQNPGATRVAGARQWRGRGRILKEGEYEKPILIYGFSQKRIEVEDKHTGETSSRQISYFPIRKVYDVSQTELIEGHTDPHDAVYGTLDGEDVDNLYERLAAVMRNWGWTVEKSPIPGGTKGVTYPREMSIVIEESLSPLEAASVMMHECAHALLHADLTDEERAGEIHRGYREVEAESTAYVLAGILGIDNSSWSTGYITGWAQGDTELLQTTAERVLWCVRTLAEALENEVEVETPA